MKRRGFLKGLLGGAIAGVGLGAATVSRPEVVFLGSPGKSTTVDWECTPPARIPNAAQWTEAERDRLLLGKHEPLTLNRLREIKAQMDALPRRPTVWLDGVEYFEFMPTYLT